MFPQQPIPTAADPDTQYLHSNSTITSSGSQVFAGFGTKEISIVVNVTSSPTGTSPTLTVTLQEVDPGDLTAVFGTVASTGTINAIGVYTASLVATTGGTVKVSWTIGGTSSPTFTGVYSTVTSKLGINSTVTGSADVTAAQGTAATLSGAWPVKVTDGTNTLPTGDAVGRAIFEKITDGTNTAAVTASSALKVDGSAVTQPVSGTVTANIGTAGSLALDATLTGGTARTKVTDGTNNAAVKAASTAAIATDPALVVAISPNNTITTSNASVGSNNATLPTSSTEIGGSDGTNLQAVRVFDADTGGGTQYVLGVGLRKAASGGSVEAGTSSDPLRVDPTGTTTQPISAASLPLPTGAATSSNQTTLGSQTTKINDGTNTAAVSAANALKVDGSAVTQPVSGTVTANIGTSGSLALDSTLTGGTAKAIVRGGAKGATVAADVTSTAEGADHQALDVQIYHGGTAKDPTQIRALASGTDTVTIVPSGTQTVSGTVTSNQGTAAALAGAWPVKVTDGTNSMPTGDAVGRAIFEKITDGTNTAAVKAASTAAIATDPALVVAVSPNNSVAVTAASLPLPSGAATSANQTTLGNQTTKINDGTNTATIKPASTAAVATDTAIVVAISPNNSITASNPSVGSNNAAIPSSSTQVGGSDGTNLQAARVFDADTGGGTQYVLGAVLRKSASGGSVEAGTSSDPLRVDPTGTTTQPISAASLPLPSGAATSANQTTLGSQTTKINDGTNTAAVKAASTAAVATDPALVVAISPNNTVLIADPNQAIGKGLTTGSTSWQGGYLATSSTSILAVRASTYLPQSANFTATIVSSSANDTSAGTAARTILITYFDQAMAGPFTETITMNGTSNVTASNSNYCYIESIVVVTAGSYGANQGNISLKNGGTTVAIVLADEVKTNLAHHYVASGKTCFIRNISLSSTVVNGSCIVKVQNPVTANSIPQQLGNFIRTISVQPQYSYPMGDLPVVGPAFIALYFRSDTATANVIYGGFTSYDA